MVTSWFFRRRLSTVKSQNICTLQTSSENSYHDNFLAGFIRVIDDNITETDDFANVAWNGLRYIGWRGQTRNKTMISVSELLGAEDARREVCFDGIIQSTMIHVIWQLRADSATMESIWWSLTRIQWIRPLARSVVTLAGKIYISNTF